MWLPKHLEDYKSKCHKLHFSVLKREEMKRVLIFVALLGVFEAYEININHEDKEIEVDFELAPLDYSKINAIPKSINWTALGAVTPPAYSRDLFHSWSDAAAGVIESRNFIAHRNLTILSKQQLEDCCNIRLYMGNILSGLLCVKQMGGIDKEASYRGCSFNQKNIGAKVIRIFQVPQGSEQVLAYYVAQGPIGTHICGRAIWNYRGGILKNANCWLYDVMNSVLIVGYGTSKMGEDYWILKTFMGRNWGEGGYMRIARNKGVAGGITNYAYYPQVL